MRKRSEDEVMQQLRNSCQGVTFFLLDRRTLRVMVNVCDVRRTEIYVELGTKGQPIFRWDMMSLVPGSGTSQQGLQSCGGCFKHVLQQLESTLVDCRLTNEGTQLQNAPLKVNYETALRPLKPILQSARGDCVTRNINTSEDSLINCCDKRCTLSASWTPSPPEWHRWHHNCLLARRLEVWNGWQTNKKQKTMIIFVADI